MQVFLIRHPPPQIDAGVCYGRLDVDCADPEPYAAALRRHLPPGTVVISSPLSRARRLAEALSPSVHIDPRLREIDFGAWEGCRWDAIARPEIDAWASDVLGFIPPGGESVAMLHARAVDFAAELGTTAHAHVALVSHAGVLRALTGHWRGLAAHEWTQLTFAYGEHVTIDLSRPDTPR